MGQLGFRGPLAQLIQKKAPFTAGLTGRVFQSSDGEIRARSHNLPATPSISNHRTPDLRIGGQVPTFDFFLPKFIRSTV